MPTFVYADFWARLGAWLIDIVVILLIAFILSFPFIALVGPTVTSQAALESRVQGFGILIAWLYNALFNSSAKQATPGKQILGIRVCDLNGERISFGRATGRFFASLISSIFFAIGYLVQPFTEKRQALHDIMAGCLVLRGKPEEISTNAEQAPATRVTASTGDAVAAPQAFTPPPRSPPAAATTPVAGKASFAVSEGGDRAVETVHVATAPLPPAPITDQEAQAIEDESYAAAWDEVEQGTTDRAAWAKAFAEAGGDEAKTRAAYLTLRAQRLAEARREEVIKKKNRERAEALVREKRKRAEAEAKAERQRNEAMAQAERTRGQAQWLEERLQAYRAEHPTPPEADILTFRNDAGKTALRIAVDACSEDRVIRLLAWGADPLAADNEGITPLAAAVSTECLKVAEILRAAEDSARKRAELRKAEMDRYGITYDGRAWRYKDFRYKSLEDAVKFAIWEDRHGPVDAT